MLVTDGESEAKTNGKRGGEIVRSVFQKSLEGLLPSQNPISNKVKLYRKTVQHGREQILQKIMKLYQPPSRPKPGGERARDVRTCFPPSVYFFLSSQGDLYNFDKIPAHYGEITRIINMSRKFVCLFICLCLSFSLSLYLSGSLERAEPR